MQPIKLNLSKFIGRTRVSIVRYSSSWEEPGIDNELEKSSDVLLFPLLFSSIFLYNPTLSRLFLECFANFPTFCSLFFQRSISSLIEHVKSILTSVSETDEGKNDDEQMEGKRECYASLYSLRIWHFARFLNRQWIALFPYRRPWSRSFVHFQPAYRTTRGTVKRHDEQAKGKEEKLLREKGGGRRKRRWCGSFRKIV